MYYSFTVLTTTGFGDLTAAHGRGRALAVVEMLVGQLYLVTVISILIGASTDERYRPDNRRGDAAFSLSCTAMSTRRSSRRRP